MFNLKDKIALVTGGGSGIGRATAIKLAEFGAKVLILGRRKDKLTETAKAIESFSGICEYKTCDITDENSVKAFFENYRKQPINILVNNAGILGTLPEDFTNIAKERFNEVFNTNIGGAFTVTQEFIKQLFNHNIGGSIVNIGSISAYAKNSNYISYAASKSALIGFSSAIASRYGCYDIRSNVILPGFIETEMSYLENPDFEKEKENLARMHPLKRIGAPEDIANSVAFLASDMSSFITGAVLIVDGGLLIAD